MAGANSVRVAPPGEPVERVDALLPQTQCRRCGAVDCHAYALAVVAGELDINRCAPGGDDTLRALAAALGREPRALAERCVPAAGATRAWIDEARCIGCAVCLRACPVDAIVGARRHMHTVIEVECTGCELCVEPCPVDCIEMRSAGTPSIDSRTWLVERAARARARYAAHQRRLQARRAQSASKRRGRAGLRAAVRAAVARVRERRAGMAGR